MSELAQFRLYIQKELEDRISEFPDLGFDEQAFVDPDQTLNKKTHSQKMSKSPRKSMKNKDVSMVSEVQGPKRINIAQTTFAFFNSEVIELLKKRGTIIGNEKWD